MKKLALALYVWLENENFHSVNSILNWVFNLYKSKYFSEFEGMKLVLENPVYTVNVERDPKTGEWSTKKYKMIVKFQEVKE